MSCASLRQPLTLQLLAGDGSLPAEDSPAVAEAKDQAPALCIAFS